MPPCEASAGATAGSPCYCGLVRERKAMWCVCCGRDALSKRNFLKRDRQRESAVCLKCAGAVNQRYAVAIREHKASGGGRRPSRGTQESLWAACVARAREELRPEVRLARLREEHVAATLAAVDDVCASLAGDVVGQVKAFLTFSCAGPHCAGGLRLVDAHLVHPGIFPPAAAPAAAGRAAASSPVWCASCESCAALAPAHRR